MALWRSINFVLLLLFLTLGIYDPEAARCPVTRQRYSVVPAPKLSGTEKLLPCHRLTPMIYYYYYYYYYIYVF